MGRATMARPVPEDLAERVLVLAPTGRDGPLACRVLRRAGLSAQVCADAPALCRELEAGAGAALLAEEALDPAATQRLSAALSGQPPWSDLPLVVVTRRCETSKPRLRALRLLEPLRNVTFLERPVRVMTLVSTVRMA